MPSKIIIFIFGFCIFWVGSLSAWQKIPVQTVQKTDGLMLYNGWKDTAWSGTFFCGYGGGATVAGAAGNTYIPVNTSEGNGALVLRTIFPSGWWNITLKWENSWMNAKKAAGTDGSLCIRLRFARTVHPYAVTLSSDHWSWASFSGVDVYEAPVDLSTYTADNTAWQTVSIPFSAFLAKQPQLDFSHISGVTLSGAANYSTESVVYIDKIAFIPRDTLYSEMVKVDQTGYLPDRPKQVLLSHLPNGLGHDSSNLTFNVLNNQTGLPVLSNKPLVRFQSDHPEWNRSGDVVWKGIFSELTMPGKYCIEIPLLGQYSAPFTISANVYDTTFRDVLRYFYFARSGEAIVEPYAEGVTRPGYFFGDTAADCDYAPGTTRNVRGGWFDAGDPHQDVVGNGLALWALLETVARVSNKVAPRSLNIPQSSSVVSDLFPLVKYQLDWLRKMTDPDGGVHYFIHYGDRSFSNARGLVSGVNSISVAVAASTFAKAHPIFKKTAAYSAYADSLLALAETCWSWLESHPATVNTNLSNLALTQYPDNQDLRKRVTAAIELFIATGKTKYHDFFTAHYADPLGGWLPWALGDDELAYLDYIACTTPGVSASVQTTLKSSYIHYADSIMANSNRSPYMPALVDPVMHWGWNGVLAIHAYVLAKAFEWTGNKAYFETALENLHWLNGRNPVNYTMITGHGTRTTFFYSGYWLDFDNQPPGYMTGGIDEMPSAEKYGYSQWKTYPEAQWYPILEPGIYWNAEAALAYSCFASGTGTTSNRYLPDKNQKSVRAKLTGCFYGDKLVIQYETSEPAPVSLCLVNSSGRLIADILNEKKSTESGKVTKRITVHDRTASGIYYLIMKAENQSCQTRLMKIR